MKRSVMMVAAVALAVVGCGKQSTWETTKGGPALTFEEFKAQTYREPFKHGGWIINGDTVVHSETDLRKYWHEIFFDHTALAVKLAADGSDAVWDSTTKNNLTYCVSNDFGGNHDTVVQTIQAATGDWSAVANVDYSYVGSEDGNCTSDNTNVIFNVVPVSGQPYLARAFFPDSARSDRTVFIDDTAFTTRWPLQGILRHELGHTLGFRHEHTRPEAGTCYEDDQWRALTDYDQASVMHYPQCNGVENGFVLTSFDVQGVQSLYGAR